MLNTVEIDVVSDDEYGALEEAILRAETQCLGVAAARQRTELAQQAHTAPWRSTTCTRQHTAAVAAAAAQPSAMPVLSPVKKVPRTQYDNQSCQGSGPSAHGSVLDCPKGDDRPPSRDQAAWPQHPPRERNSRALLWNSPQTDPPCEGPYPPFDGHILQSHAPSLHPHHHPEVSAPPAQCRPAQAALAAEPAQPASTMSIGSQASTTTRRILHTPLIKSEVQSTAPQDQLSRIEQTVGLKAPVHQAPVLQPDASSARREQQRVLPASLAATSSLDSQRLSGAAISAATLWSELQRRAAHTDRSNIQLPRGAKGPSDLPPLLLEGPIRYAVTRDEIEVLVADMLEAKPQVVGFDMEWRFSRTDSSVHYKTSLIQFAYYTSPEAHSRAVRGVMRTSLNAGAPAALVAQSVAPAAGLPQGASAAPQRPNVAGDAQPRIQTRPQRVSAPVGCHPAVNTESIPDAMNNTYSNTHSSTFTVAHNCMPLSGSAPAGPHTTSDSQAQPTQPAVHQSRWTKPTFEPPVTECQGQASSAAPYSAEPSARTRGEGSCNAAQKLSPLTAPDGPLPVARPWQYRQSASGGCWFYPAEHPAGESLFPSRREPEVVSILLQITGFEDLPPLLTRALTDPAILKAGLNVRGDAARLKGDFGVIVQGVSELDTLANSKVLCHRQLITTNLTTRRWSLQALVVELFRVDLPKDSAIRCGNWDLKPLPPSMMRYAALDAYAGLICHVMLSELPERRYGRISAPACSTATRQ